MNSEPWLFREGLKRPSVKVSRFLPWKGMHLLPTIMQPTSSCSYVCRLSNGRMHSEGGWHSGGGNFTAM